MQGRRESQTLRRRVAGNAGAYFLVDYENGTALTVWKSEEAARRSDKAADQSRAGTIEAADIPWCKGRYDVVARI